MSLPGPTSVLPEAEEPAPHLRFFLRVRLCHRSSSQPEQALRIGKLHKQHRYLVSPTVCTAPIPRGLVMKWPRDTEVYEARQ